MNFLLSSSKPSKTIEKKVRRASAVSQILRNLHDQNGFDSYQLENFSFSVASDFGQLGECYSLAYREYLKKGYVKSENISQMIVNDYDLNKTTMVVMAKNKLQEVVGTLTIVVDDNRGLPCDELFSNELTTMRQNGAKLAEVVRLAISSEFQNSKEILVGMFNLVCNYIKNITCGSDLLIEVNPRHVKYYQRLLLFKIMSDVRECHRVEGAPAVLLCLNKADVLAYRKSGQEKEYLKSLHPHLSTGLEELHLANMIRSKMLRITYQTREEISNYIQLNGSLSVAP